jgi:hypothetical protein
LIGSCAADFAFCFPKFLKVEFLNRNCTLCLFFMQLVLIVCFYQKNSKFCAQFHFLAELEK